MRSSKHEEQMIVDYIASQTDGEIVEFMEKITSERVAGQKHDVWNVHTDKERYWVITNPTNLYFQNQFPHMDIAITFHVGLMMKVMDRSRYTPSPQRVKRFANPLRRLDQAVEALSVADEAEEFQAIGMLCRECLIAFVKEASSVVNTTASLELPKASDYVGWSDLIAATIADGPSAERRRGYLKATAKATWELVNWLTHTTNATRYDADFAINATDSVLSAFMMAVIRFERGPLDRCPQCGSYRLSSAYRFNDEDTVMEFAFCDGCGWEGDARISEDVDKAKTRRKARKQPEDLGECITVEVPLRGPKPPKPSRMIKSED